MAQDGVFVYPDAGRGNNGTDLLAAAALMGNGGFGGMNNPLWMMFMWPMLYPMMSMFGGFGCFGGWNNAFNGNGYVANQLNNDAGREVIMQAIKMSYSSLCPTVFTFSNTPKVKLKGKNPSNLLTFEDKIEILNIWGIKQICQVDFSDVMNFSPEEFVCTILKQNLK